MTARLASHEAFKQAGIEFVPALAGIKLAIDRQTRDRPVIRMTTDRPVNEPFLSLLVELSWSAGRLMREYTFLLDPAPELLPARQSAMAPPAKGGAPAVAQPMPVAPAAQPQAGPTEKTHDGKTAEAQGGREREVKKGDYLRKIASETQYDGVSLEQMLVAIFDHNRQAFIDNNMHRLKAGKILRIPERETVAAVEAGKARKIVSAHTADFNAYRQKLAAAVGAAQAPQEEVASQTAAGKIGTKVEEKAPAAAQTKDQLKIAKADASTKAREAQGRVAALEEDLSAKERALQEAQSRQAELEKNIQDLQKLIELKNRQLAELQKQAESKPVPSTPSAPPAKAPETAPVAAAPAVAEKPAEPVVSAPKPQTEAAPVQQAAKPAQAPTPAAKKKTPPPPPPPEPDFIDELLANPAIVAGGLIVLGLLGLIAYRQRRKKSEQAGAEASPSTTANLAANSVFGTTGGQSVDTTGSSMATGFSQASISAIDTDEGVDPVAEADVYMAYGRDAQAEEILLDALKSDPTRTAIHVKLLEIYAGRKNLKQFETLASDLYAQTGGVGSDWEKAAAMGLKLDPANPLYGGAAGGKPAQGADSMVAVPDAGDKTMHDTWTMPGELSQISEAVEKGGAATVILEKPVEAATAAPLPPVLDFDLDLGGPSAATGAAEPPPAAATAASGIDFDLGLDFEPTTQSKPAESDPTATIVLDASAASRAPAVDLPLDIKLDSPEAATSEEALHFDLDLGEPAAPAAGSAPEPVDQEKTLAGAKALDFEFDLGEPAAAPPASQTSPPTLDLAAIDLDLGEAPAEASDAGVEPAADDEVSTKLELAKAYEEMGDKEGARELLNEVIKQGSAEQQAKAQSMLAKLG